MSSKNSQTSLEKDGLIKKCPVDRSAVTRLARRAQTDLRTARRNLREGPEGAYNYAYNAMLRTGLGLMFSRGFRPEIKDKHLTAVRFVGSALGGEFKKLVNDYDMMRRKRHKFIYEPGMPCSLKEAVHSLSVAEEFVEAVVRLIEAGAVQTGLKLGERQQE